ncbi:hypothetical protein EV129_12757 [Rhizobium azibense]|uniref:Uncharacterized protein n=2 Tax=Rhizobium azibense TaxID=1136135 RepID=A0A4R3RDT3_9HYPH|nr:hypothetical protein EV129_12757 [Rhizobium azibense]
MSMSPRLTLEIVRKRDQSGLTMRTGVSSRPIPIAGDTGNGATVIEGIGSSIANIGFDAQCLAFA